MNTREQVSGRQEVSAPAVRKGLCLGTNTAVGGMSGGMRRGRKAPCPVCKRLVGMRPGRDGRLYPHTVRA